MASRRDFLSAIIFGDVKKVRKLLKAPGFNKVNAKFRGVMITLSVRHKHLEIAKLLINNGAKVKKARNYSMTMPLLHATRFGNIKLAKYLVSADANVNAQARNGSTPLHFAAKCGDFNMVKYLLQHGADTSIKDPSKKYTGFTALHYACYTRKIKCVKTLVKYSNCEVNPRDDETIHPIQISVVTYQNEITAFLINYIDHINIRFNRAIYKFFRDPFLDIFESSIEGPTLLHWAVATGEEIITKLLIDNCANVNLKTFGSDITPLMLAAQQNNKELLSLILSQNPDVDDVDRSGNTALHYVFYYKDAHQSRYSTSEFLDRKEDNKMEIIYVLIHKYRADGNAKCSFEHLPNLSSALDLAIYFGLWETVRYLLYTTNVGFNQIDYSKIELAAFDESAIEESFQDNIVYINARKFTARDIQCTLAAYIFSRHRIGIHATKDTLIKLDALISIMEKENWSHRYIQEKGYILKSLEFIKFEKIGQSEISYWDVVTKNREDLVKLAFNEDFASIKDVSRVFDDKIFYHYYWLIFSKFVYAEKKSKALGTAIEIINDLFGTVLPYDCCEAIAYSMTNAELIKLTIEL